MLPLIVLRFLLRANFSRICIPPFGVFLGALRALYTFRPVWVPPRQSSGLLPIRPVFCFDRCILFGRFGSLLMTRHISLILLVYCFVLGGGILGCLPFSFRCLHSGYRNILPWFSPPRIVLSYFPLKIP